MSERFPKLLNELSFDLVQDRPFKGTLRLVTRVLGLPHELLFDQYGRS